MKKLISLAIALILALASIVSASAISGEVRYNGNAKQFIFNPGSEYSPTDLFPEFKSVMPGDSITQKITVKNDKSNDCKVKIYMRALGAHEESVDFLKQLDLKVEKAEDNEMGYMFDAAASRKAQLKKWKYLGTLYSGGEVDLNVILDVPAELDNEYAEKIGYLDWEFKVEELPVEEGDPEPPETGESRTAYIVLAVLLASVFIIIILASRRKKASKS